MIDVTYQLPRRTVKKVPANWCLRNGFSVVVDGDESPRSGGECGVRSFSPHLTQEPRTWLR